MLELFFNELTGLLTETHPICESCTKQLLKIPNPWSFSVQISPPLKLDHIILFVKAFQVKI